jgi:hypothetical protein
MNQERIFKEAVAGHMLVIHGTDLGNLAKRLQI